jgi:DNA-binding winged helix-turn-helix (wHTH) protein/TolB-like protein/Tfp pilus assembly protein PilF
MPRLRVGDWLLDPAMNQISRGAKVERLEPKAVEVLVALAQRAGEVVTRETLLSEVWKGVTVSDDALTQSITKLRQALGDTSKESSYIQTISKRGYRLIAAVAPYDAGALATSDSIQRTVPPLRHLRITHWVMAAAALVTALAVYWLIAYPLSRSDSTITELPAATINSSELQSLPEVVVQPFSETEGDQLQTLLARGFTARLITDLSRLPDIRVVSPRIARASPEVEPAKKTAAGNYQVTGEVQRNGDNIRVYIHLTEAVSGHSLWSEQYDRPYTDIFSLQDDLTRQVLGVLRVKVTNAELLRSSRPYTRNLEAYENFLRAQSALIIRSKAENEIARQMYSRAIQLDPNFARAYAGLALTYAADRRNFWRQDGAAALATAFDLAKKAHQIDPDIPEVYFALAFVHMERGEFSQAVDELHAALRLSPSFADAYALLGGIQTYRGQPRETIPLMRTAMRLVPDSGHLYFLILGRAYFFLGDGASAVLYLRKAIARNPENLEIRFFLAAALNLTGQHEDAAWEAEEIRILEPTFSIREWLKNYPMSDAKQIKQLIDAVSGAGL